MRNKLFASVAFAALILPSAAFAQSTGSLETGDDAEIVVTGSRTVGIDGMIIPDAPKARQVLTGEAILRNAPGNTVLDSLNIIPGVNFTQSDPFGSSGGNIRIRGFDGNRISLTFDGFPLNDTGNYAVYSNQQLDPELIDTINVNLGTTDIDSPTASAAGGTINYRTIVPSEDFSVLVSGSAGENDFMRIFGLIQPGTLTSFGTKMFASASMARNDKFKGPGQIRKQQFNVGFYQPIGSNGDFLRISGHYNENRNNFYRNPGVNDLRTLLGTPRIPAAASASAASPIDLGEMTLAQQATIIGFENEPICRRPTAGAGAQNENVSGGTSATGNCTNFYGVRINPSNTGNVRFNSRFTLSESLILTADASFQYTLANGGGSTAIAENSVRVRGGTPAAAGVDYNGDGDFADTIRFYTPNNTNTRRITATTSLIYNLDDSNRLRIAYTFDRGNHRQTGEWGYLDGGSFPESPFGGRNARPVLTADGFKFQQRDRLSIALLNQVSGEYIGKFFDNSLTVQIGVRAPFFKRELDQRCYTEARGSAGFAYCTSEPVASLRIVAPGSVIPPSGGATPYYAPYKASYAYDAILPNAGLVYKFGDFNIFASYAKGFSAPRTDNLYRSPFVGVLPEKTDAFDLGIRMSTRTVQAQATAWYITYQNRIVTSFDPDQGISIDRNVGKVNSYGVDASLTVSPIRELSLTGMASYINAELQDDILLSGSGVTAVYALTKGKKVTETPSWQLGGRAQLTLGPVDLAGQVKWVDERFATDVNDVVTPAYTLVDVDVRLNMDQFGLAKSYFQLNVKNLFDQFYFGNISTQINAAGNPNFSVGYPRTIMGTLVVGF